MRDFQVLFDHGERSEIPDPVYAAYGELGFPAAPADRPWIFANFVQTVDGIVSLLGAQASGSDISQSPEDRWLMDLLRAHADAVLIGMGTLRVETALGRPGPRGPVFRIVDPAIRELREKLHRGPERNILLTSSRFPARPLRGLRRQGSGTFSADHVFRRGEAQAAIAAAASSPRDSLRRRASRRFEALAMKSSRSILYLAEGEVVLKAWAHRLALGIVSVRCEPEPNGACIALLGRREVLRKTRVASNQKRQNTGGHGIERAKMADGTLSGDLAQPRHYIVARHPARLVNDQNSVHLTTLLHPGHRLITSVKLVDARARETQIVFLSVESTLPSPK